jgi:phosphoglycerate kinase
MKIKTITDLSGLADKTIFLRLDLNVPMIDGQISEDYKIKAAQLSISKLLNSGAKIVIASHLGDPMVDGRLMSGAKSKLSMKPVVARLSELLGCPIDFLSGQDLIKIKNKLNKSNKQLFVIDNLRFWPGELINDADFAKELASLADLYINDAFAVSHRRQASVAAIKSFLPSFAGPLLEREVINLSQALKPKQPIILVLGGAKVDTKVNLIDRLGRKAQKILIGGGLANNFLAAKGYNVGESLMDKKSIGLAEQLIKKFNKKLIIPSDVIVADLDNQPALRSVDLVGNKDKILDIGPVTIQEFSRQIKIAKTIVWNGPMGKFEEEHYNHGTLFVARDIACRSRGESFGLVGGGETVAALQMTKMANYVDWVSTAGGAMLAFLGGEEMPGLDKII